MTRAWRLVAVLAPLAVTVSCAMQPQRAGIETAAARCQMTQNAGPASPDQGIGGTGSPAGQSRRADRGIGGTGVVGVITGFASVCLSGEEVELAPSTVIAVDGAGATLADLRVGQLAVVTAAELADGRLVAQLVRIRHEVLGPVEQIDGDRIVVAGQDVILPPTAIQAGLARLGASVAVSGMRDFGGAIVASRLDPAGPDRVRVHGRVRHDADGVARIGRMPVPPPLDATGASSWVLASGESDGARTRLDDVAPDLWPDDPAAYFDNAARRFVVETYVRLAAGEVEFGTGLKVVMQPGLIGLDASGGGTVRLLAVVTMALQGDGALLVTGLRDIANGAGAALGHAPRPAALGPPTPGPGVAAPAAGPPSNAGSGAGQMSGTPSSAGKGGSAEAGPGAARR